MLMNPAVNLNGTSRESLVQVRRDAMDAVMSAMKALQETLPHGRDYVGRAHQYDLDRATYRERFAKLDSLYNELQEEALAILTAGPKGGEV